MAHVQVDSFIPGWEWDMPPPKKKKVGGSSATDTEGLPRRWYSLTHSFVSAAQGRRGQSGRLEQKEQEKQRGRKQDGISAARCHRRGCWHEHEHEYGQSFSNNDRGRVGWSRQEQRRAAG